jgi:hypothetical protein
MDIFFVISPAERDYSILLNEHFTFSRNRALKKLQYPNAQAYFAQA